MPKIISLLLVFIILLTANINVFATNPNIKIYVNGNLQTYIQQPAYVGNSVFVPMIALTSIGARIESNRSNTIISIYKDNLCLSTGVGSKLLSISYIEIDSDGSQKNVNSRNIKLDAAPVILNGAVMIPLRAFFEQFGAKVTWDNKLKAAMITTTDVSSDIASKGIGEIMPKISIDEAYLNKVNDKIVFENDLRVFTLYAFMNFTGYNDENNIDGFSEVRKLVRDDLQKMNLQLSDNSYYTNRNLRFDKYGMALRMMGEAPEFGYIQANANIPQGLSDLGAKLEEFYSKAAIEELYKKYTPYYDKEIAKYQTGVSTDLAYTLKYLGIDIDPFSKIYIEINLLDAYERGSGLGMKDSVKGNVIMTGPSYNSLNRINIDHEFLHGVINPITDQYKANFRQEDYRMPSLSDSTAYKQGYTSWESIVTESFVRALSIMSVYRNDDFQLKNRISQETKDGFVMTQYIFDRFSKEYSSYTGGLEAFVKDILANYKQ